MSTITVSDGWLRIYSPLDYDVHVIPLEDAIPKLEFLLKAARLQYGSG